MKKPDKPCVMWAVKLNSRDEIHEWFGVHATRQQLIKAWNKHWGDPERDGNPNIRRWRWEARRRAGEVKAVKVEVREISTPPSNAQ